MNVFKTILNAAAGSPARAFTSGIGLAMTAVALSGYGLPLAFGVMALMICGVTGLVLGGILVCLAGAFDAIDPEHRLNAPAQEGKDKP